MFGGLGKAAVALGAEGGMGGLAEIFGCSDAEEGEGLQE